MNLRLITGLLLLIIVSLVLPSCGASLPAGCPPDCVGKNLNNRDLRRADMSGAHLMDADMHQVVMVGTNLSGADLSGARLVEANLEGANLDHAILVGAKSDLIQSWKHAG